MQHVDKAAYLRSSKSPTSLQKWPKSWDVSNYTIYFKTTPVKILDNYQKLKKFSLSLTFLKDHSKTIKEIFEESGSEFKQFFYIIFDMINIFNFGNSLFKRCLTGQKHLVTGILWIFVKFLVVYIVIQQLIHPVALNTRYVKIQNILTLSFLVVTTYDLLLPPRIKELKNFCQRF